MYELTLRTYLVIKTMERTGCGWPAAQEAVSSTAMEHDWDLTERRTFPEWEHELGERT